MGVDLDFIFGQLFPENYFLNIQNLASMAGSMNANVTSAPFFSAREITGFAADRPCSDNDDFLAGFFLAGQHLAANSNTFFPPIPGMGGDQGVEPTATMTASGANFCTASGVASLFNAT